MQLPECATHTMKPASAPFCPVPHSTLEHRSCSPVAGYSGEVRLWWRQHSKEVTHVSGREKKVCSGAGVPMILRDIRNQGLFKMAICYWTVSGLLWA